MTGRKQPIGLYLHIPFCDGKCPYCDFYSLSGTQAEQDAYCSGLSIEIKRMGEKLNRRADTIYFGGGTPGLLGHRRLQALLLAAEEAFSVARNAEITVEVNPGSAQSLDFSRLRRAGVNRLSVGLQSASEKELRFLGRRHTPQDAMETVKAAKQAGIENISLDLMLGLQGQDIGSVKESIRFCKEAGAAHISAYLLKIEPDTLFGQRRGGLSLPDEDETADLYLASCEALEAAGYRQYEISNFSLPGKESRHNLKYWDGGEYLGLGPTAHSFLNGKRFYTPRGVDEFLNGPVYFSENEGDGEIPDGGEEEYVMLRLRLAGGVTFEGYRERFQKEIPERYLKNAGRFVTQGMAELDGNGFRLTRQGFLLSNYLIGEILS